LGALAQGKGQSWLLALPAIVYSLVSSQIAFFGGFEAAFPDPARAASVALNMIVDGGFQEIAFRGLLLLALVRAWGKTQRGTVKSVLVSALFFGGLHLLNLAAGARAPVTGLQMADTLISGVYYAALVLYGGNIWPIVLWHGLLNAIVSARAIGMPDFAETAAMWARMILFNLPLLIYGLYLLYRLRRRAVMPEAN
jgi:hypothetical protein